MGFRLRTVTLVDVYIGRIFDVLEFILEGDVGYHHPLYLGMSVRYIRAAIPWLWRNVMAHTFLDVTAFGAFWT